MEENFSFNHLDETEFESFCCDLLDELGFVNINWRKGTGKSSSPSDGGRDIECELEVEDIDGEKDLEKWFVECKHYEKGVPFKDIQGILAASISKKPDKVLIIASNFFSNPAKNDLKDYIKENKPSFKIKIWENPDLKKLALNKRNLLRKYKITNSDFSFLNLMHPAHIEYVKDHPTITLNYFFIILDNLDPEKRDKILEMTYYAVIKHLYKDPITGKDIDSSNIQSKISYEQFKIKTYYLSRHVEEYFLLFSIVSFTLSFLFKLGDKTSNKSDESFRSLVEFTEKIKSKEIVFDDAEFKKMGIDPNDVEGSCDKRIESIRKDMCNIPSRQEEGYELYIYFCDKVVNEMFKRDLLGFSNEK